MSPGGYKVEIADMYGEDHGPNCGRADAKAMWYERRSAASIRRSAVSSLCAHREELAGRQILREWRSLCVRLVLLRKLAEVGGYRHRSAYLRRAFNVLKWGGLRTWRRGLTLFEGAMRSALQRRGRKILSMLLRHSVKENIEQRNLGFLESFRRSSLRNTVRLALLRWRKEVVDTHERLRKLEMIFVELTVGGRRCFSAWRDYSRERRRKTRVLDQISRQVDVKARKEEDWLSMSGNEIGKSRRRAFIDAFYEVHGQLKAGMSSLRGCHQRNVHSRMRLLLLMLMLSTLSFLSRRAIKREFFRQWCWSTLDQKKRNLRIAQSEDTLVVWRVLLMWRMLAWRRMLGCRGLEGALVKCRRRRLMIAVYARSTE
ncbi:hypothetical protein FOZ61_007744 [Perkinsus olseni]|uniref:Uncharacterized protein n=1 Tax=Perkinsus olseni TaxID=32597 RepID=A0A7J6L7I4_PEROL|nr:hypothetical protein FOZ61_007744 [Perkinsus olseni]KAF4656417.1 hypothetical protein FOL46_007838 [Perkinsus olseni]